MLHRRTRARARRDRGVTAIEYALLIAGIAGVVALIAFGLSPVLRDGLGGFVSEFGSSIGGGGSESGGGGPGPTATPSTPATASPSASPSPSPTP